MNILQVNNFFYNRSGASRYFFELSKLLREFKHNIAYFSMQDYRNKKTKWSKYFISNISLNKKDFQVLIRIIEGLTYSFELKKSINSLISEYPQDIIHLHSIYHYVPLSVIAEVKNKSIPLIQSVHDYHSISVNYNMFHNGKICEITKQDKFYKAFFHKCVKNSYIYSLAEVVEKYFHFFTGWERNYIDYFIAPSIFMQNKLVEYGIDSKKIIHLPYFIDYQKYKQNFNSGDYILYFGRLAPEKGLSFLLDVMAKLPHIKLLIVGRGQEEMSLKLKVKSEKLKNVEFLGFMDGQNLKKVISESRFTVLPSQWYDVAPISILESLACGKPVVASNIGGIPEIIKEGYNGFLAETSNIDDWRVKINKLWNNTLICTSLGKNAQEYLAKNFDPKNHYEKIINIYKRATVSHR